MSRRRRRRTALRDALARALVERVRRRLRGRYDVGLAITEIGIGGVRVSARVDRARVDAWLAAEGLQPAMDALADKLVRLKASP